MELEAHLPFWGELTREQREKLSRAAVERTFPQGTLVSGGSEDCTGLVLPLTGQLRAYLLTEEGKELTLYRLFPGDLCLFSASCAMRGIQFDVMVEAQRDTRALLLPAPVYRDLMESSVPVANFTNQLMAGRFSDVMWLMDQILSKKLDSRLAAFLVEEGRLAEALERLARFETAYEGILREQEELAAKMEPLKAAGRQKSVQFRELLAQKLTVQNLIGRFEIYGIQEPQ